jgi:PAS domain S-box-containing protein
MIVKCDLSLLLRVYNHLVSQNMVPPVPESRAPDVDAPARPVSGAARPPVVLRARLHYGSPLFGYILSVALVAITTVLRLALIDSGEARLPFVPYFPAIIVASFVAGAGPGMAAVFLAAAIASILFPPPLPASWIALSIIGPLLSTGFAHLRYIRDRNRAIALELVKFKYIGDHASDWILLLNDAGYIRYVNLKAANDLGWTERDLNGRHVDSLVRPAQQEALGTAIELAKSGSARPVELEFERRDYSTVLMEINFTAVITGEEQIIYAAARDITERKQIENRLHEIRHWESMGALSAGLAHDFNNLLTSILGHASLARNIIGADPEVTPMLNEIISAAERSSDLVRMLLATAGYRSRFSERLHVDELLEATLARQRLPPNVRISKETEAATIVGDRRSFETLLWSLISNAVEAYGGKEGEVRVAIRSGRPPETQSASFEEGAVSSADCLGIVVADRGEGMSPEVLKRAFDPFFSTRFPGRGLGLPAVRGIVRAHSGRLSLITAVGQGTRVEVWLPMPR